MDIAIIGGGAAGLAAALAARESLDNAVTVFERQNRVGRKLLATGNGRCNLTNLNASPENYHGHDPDFSGPALYRFGPERTLEWFRSLGLITRAEPSGRVYPLSDTAGSVVDVLRLALEARGGAVQCALPIARAEKIGEKFHLIGPLGESFTADRLIVACGGAAGARVGGVRSGYDILRSFGHGCTDLRPALVQLKTDNTWTRAMKGVRDPGAGRGRPGPVRRGGAVRRLRRHRPGHLRHLPRRLPARGGRGDMAAAAAGAG